MADFVSHHLFGEQALAVYPAPVQALAESRPACFYWGCQGPDPLFYRKVLFGSPLHKLGNRMHSERTDRLFAALAHGVHDLTGTAHEIASAYFYGFLCHYALDSEIHPYVYCRQEQIRSVDTRLSGSAVHCQIESDIDSLVYERVRRAPVTTFSPADSYTLEAEEKAVLAALLHAVLKAVYGADAPPYSLRRAFDEMLAWETFFYSESRGIYRAAQRLERLAGRGALLTGHMKTELPAWDALNLEHEPWGSLWTPGEVRTDSVPELFGLARIRAASLAGQYAAQFDAGWLLRYHFDAPFDNGNPKRLAAQTE